MFGELLAAAHPDGATLSPLIPGIPARLLVQGSLRGSKYINKESLPSRVADPDPQYIWKLDPDRIRISSVVEPEPEP